MPIVMQHSNHSESDISTPADDNSESNSEELSVEQPSVQQHHSRPFMGMKQPAGGMGNISVLQRLQMQLENAQA